MEVQLLQHISLDPQSNISFNHEVSNVNQNPHNDNSGFGFPSGPTNTNFSSDYFCDMNDSVENLIALVHHSSNDASGLIPVQLSTDSQSDESSDNEPIQISESPSHSTRDINSRPTKKRKIDDTARSDFLNSTSTSDSLDDAHPVVWCVGCNGGYFDGISFYCRLLSVLIFHRRTTQHYSK
jgi:hypothetical protein